MPRVAGGSLVTLIPAGLVVVLGGPVIGTLLRLLRASLGFYQGGCPRWRLPAA